MGVELASRVVVQEKTHTSYESVGLMFKVYKFMLLYFVVIFEVVELS